MIGSTVIPLSGRRGLNISTKEQLNVSQRSIVNRSGSCVDCCCCCCLCSLYFKYIIVSDHIRTTHPLIHLWYTLLICFLHHWTIYLAIFYIFHLTHSDKLQTTQHPHVRLLITTPSIIPIVSLSPVKKWKATTVVLTLRPRPPPRVCLPRYVATLACQTQWSSV